MNEDGIITKELKELKRKLRSLGYDYFNQYLSIKILKQIYSNSCIKDNSLIVEFEKIDQTFFERFKMNDSYIRLNGRGIYVLSKELNDTFIEQFNSIDSVIKNSDILNVRNQEDDSYEITNITHVENTTFIPNNRLELLNLHTLMNKYDNFKFKLNEKIPLSEDKDFNFNRINVVRKFEINIKSKVFREERIEKIVSEFVYTCPNCFSKIFVLPNQTYTDRRHACDGFISSTGKQSYTSINKNNKAASNSREVYLYEFTINKEKRSRYAYSFDSNLMPGRHTADILLTVDSLDADTKDNLAIILGIQKQKIKIIEDLVTSNDAKKWCKDKGLPYAKFLDTLFSIRKLYSNYTGHSITDKGMLNQLFITISGLAKKFMKFRCFGISVLANASLSKTYTGHLFALPLDRDYLYIQNGTDVSIPGLKGGINNTKEINGKITTVFEEGVFTKGGLTIFDEGKPFFNDAMLNESLKDLFNDSINIQKIGGKQGIKQNYTPIIYSNKSDHHNEYESHIKNVYAILVRDKDLDVPHDKTEQGVARYIASINLYMPISHYTNTENNETLAKAISFCRDYRKIKDISWRTGGSIPANYRLLFDVFCLNREETFETIGERSMGRHEVILPEIYDIPFEEFQAALENHYGNIDVDLHKLKNNSPEKNKQLNLLFEDINKFLLTDGVDIHIHLSDNCKKMDEKLASLVSSFFCVLQLLEDKDSTALTDNVKEWGKLILLKCKRGILEKEYNFESHPKFEFKRFEYSETLGSVGELKRDRDMNIVINTIRNEEKGVNALENAEPVNKK